MKNLKTTILLFMIIVSLATIVLAETFSLTVKTTASKSEIKIGEKTIVTVNWEKGMQAADFVLNYDSAKLKFISTDVPDGNYVNENGKIKVMWYSASQEAVEKKQFTFTFEGIAAGNANLELVVDGGFATGSLQRPESYNMDVAKTVVTVIGSNTNNTVTNKTNTTLNNVTNNISNKVSNTTIVNIATNTSTGSGSSIKGNSAEISSTNPTEKPTSIPKAGKANVILMFVTLITATVFFSYQVKKYKDI